MKTAVPPCLHSALKVPGKDRGPRKHPPMPDVQFCAGRVREHFEHVQLGLFRFLFVKAVELRFFPTRLPFLFYRFYVHIVDLVSFVTRYCTPSERRSQAKRAKKTPARSAEIMIFSPKPLCEYAFFDRVNKSRI